MLDVDQKALQAARVATRTALMSGECGTGGAADVAITAYLAALPSGAEPVAWQVTQYDPNGRLYDSVSLVRGSLPGYYRTERWGSTGHIMWEVVPLVPAALSPVKGDGQ